MTSRRKEISIFFLLFLYKLSNTTINYVIKNLESQIKYQVIYGYLNGKSRDQIARECGISTGTTSTIIKEWKKRIKTRDIDEIRKVLVLMRKSEMTIEQCSIGFRIYKILESLGFQDKQEDDDDNGDEQENNDKSNTENSNYYGFLSFLIEIYFKCRKYDMKPSFIFTWVKDLFEYIGSLGYNNKTVLFISQISNHINKKKKECNQIKNEKIKLKEEQEKINQNIVIAKENIAKITQREKKILQYLDWFYKLKKELWDKYNIKIEDISNFAKVIDDFENHNYDAYEIIKEYSEHGSIKEEILNKKSTVKILTIKEKELNEEIASLLQELSVHKLKVETYYKLEAIGMDIKVLKQLKSLIFQIAQANDIPYYKAIPKFFNDIQEQYDYKLGFETKIDELKTESEKIKKEIPNYRYNLHLQYLVQPILDRLLQNGVTEEDIICINLLLTKFSHNEFYLFESNETDTDKNKIKGKDRVSKWHLFINSLEKIGNINAKIIEQRKKVNEIENQVANVEDQKKKLETGIEKYNGLLNYLFIQTYILIGFLNHIYKYLKRDKTTSQYIFLLLNIICINTKKDDNYSKGKENQDK